MPFHIITPEIQHANAVDDMLSGHDVIVSPFWRRSNNVHFSHSLPVFGCIEIVLMQVGIGDLDRSRLAGLPGAGEDDQALPCGIGHTPH